MNAFHFFWNRFTFEDYCKATLLYMSLFQICMTLVSLFGSFEVIWGIFVEKIPYSFFWFFSFFLPFLAVGSLTIGTLRNLWKKRHHAWLDGE